VRPKNKVNASLRGQHGSLGGPAGDLFPPVPLDQSLIDERDVLLQCERRKLLENGSHHPNCVHCGRSGRQRVPNWDQGQMVAYSGTRALRCGVSVS